MATIVDFNAEKLDRVVTCTEEEYADAQFALFLMEDGTLVASNEECPPEGTKLFIGLLELEPGETLV